MDTMDAIAAFENYIFKQEGIPYIWCGKGPFFDCSGLQTTGLYVASRGRLDWRHTHGAARLYEEFEPIVVPERGAFCFYGAPGAIDHIMYWCGDNTGRVFGACGGGHLNTTVEVSLASDAKVRYRPTHLYRKDFRGFARFPLHLVEQAIKSGREMSNG